MKHWATLNVNVLLTALLMLGFVSGCTDDPPPKSPPAINGTADLSARLGPQTSPVAVDMSEGWCGGHGVPESVCTRCNSSLIPKFKSAGDWCEEHGLPESQCTMCNPEVRGRWASLQSASPRSKDLGHPARLGPETSPVAVDMSEGWCGGHGVPESVCTRCNSSLIPKFKSARDWCEEHGLPESQCTICNPEVRERWASLQPGSGSPRSEDLGHPAKLGPQTSPVAVDMSEGWCGGHGVPESVCTRCNSSLIPKFKSAGDWCEEHGLPESQCTICNPEVRERCASLKPGSPGSEDLGQAAVRDGGREFARAEARGSVSSERSDDGNADIRVERAARLLTGVSDPLCQVDMVRVRFVDPSIAAKAGIEVESVKRRRMSAAIEVPAEVEFDATRVTRITPRVAGSVRGAPVNIGDHVEAGDLLAVIESSVLGEAKSRYIERRENLRLAEADFHRARTIHTGAQRMLEICTPDATAQEIGEALAGVPIGDAKASLLRAHASLLLAKAEAARELQLLEKSISSERKYQRAQSALAVAQADFAAIREEIAFTSERDRLAGERTFQVDRSALDTAVRQLHILGLSENQVAVVGTEPAELLCRYELRSPVSGRVVERTVAVGEAAHEADVLFVIADNSTMWLVADVYERDLVQLRRGLSVLFTVDGLGGVSFQGTLNWISSQVDDLTRTVRVRADLSNKEGLLRAKMFGRARIVLHDSEEVLSVPVEAVQTDGCCQLVFIRQSDTVYQPRKVLLGTSANGFVEILKGLDEGEVVATTGSFLMKTEILKSNIGAGCCEVDPGR